MQGPGTVQVAPLGAKAAHDFAVPLRPEEEWTSEILERIVPVDGPQAAQGPRLRTGPSKTFEGRSVIPRHPS